MHRLRIKNCFSMVTMLACIVLFLQPLHASPTQPQPSPGSIAGDWAGSLQAGSHSLRVIIHITADPAGHLNVTFDSPDQGALGIPGANAKLAGSHFSFELPAAHGSYRGVVRSNGTSIDGTWTQGQALTLNFTLQAKPQTTPALAPPASIVENAITFPTEGGLTAPGTLAMPAHPAASVPIVIMVQGSGVQDRDETVGPNKIFRDLAWGLGEQGIATLRYDRRPKFAPQSFAQHPDLDHEIALDAVAALRYASTLQGIDHRKIYLLGHSLGGTMAPYIARDRLAQQPASVAGIIFLAAGATPVDVAILRQIHDLGTQQGASPTQIAAMQAKWQEEVFTPAKNPATPAGQPLGVGAAKAPAAYWRDWLARNPIAVLKTLPIPALVLRGSADINVTAQDFDAFKSADAVKGSMAREFPGLNHEFIQTKTAASPLSSGRVSPQVIQTIASWMQQAPAANLPAPSAAEKQ